MATVRARSRVLAEDLYSQVDLPHFHRAAMDGYAVKAKDTFGASQSLPAYLKLAGVVEMGKEATQAINKGEAMPGRDSPKRVTVAKRDSDRRRYQKRRTDFSARAALACP
jgi:hypothetical protein